MSADEIEQQAAVAAAGGDRDAVAWLIDHFYDRIHRMAWRWCGSAQAAEDVAHDVCVNIAPSIRGFKGEAAISTWIWRVTYNAAVDAMRERKRVRPVAPSDIVALVDAPVLETPETRALDSDLWVAVRRLPPQQRDAVLLVYAEDMSHAEAGRIMNCTEKTVSWHLHEARKTLKAVLEAAE
jgi:RNA polymerase sigma-70 factor (ECF subfamily)